jgi:ABC-type polar amino acid transport system ATPase subunit
MAKVEIKYTFPFNNGIFFPPWPKITLVFQKLFLWPHLTIRENICLAPIKRKIPSWKLVFEEIIEDLDLLPLIERYPNETSVGQQQRASLARALVLNPKYLFLDEVTSALDVENIEIILLVIKKAVNRGIGFLVVTHYLGFAQRIANRIIFLDNGNILEEGGLDILTNPLKQRTKDFLSLFNN